MDSLIFRACAIVIIAVIMVLVIKKDSPAFALILSLAASLLILFLVLPRLSAVLDTLRTVAGNIKSSGEYIGVAIKVIGIAWAAEFGANVCADAGEQGIASKIELAGKVLIMAASAPVILTLLDRVINLL